MGENELGNIKNNAKPLIENCANYIRIIGSRLFPHRNVHKATWTSPDLRTKNQIDHTRRSLLDVTGFRCAYVASDHYLLIDQIRIKMATIHHKDN